MLQGRSSIRKAGDGGCDNDEADTVDEVADDQRPPATEVVDEEDGAKLCDDGQNVADALILQRLCRTDADCFVDLWTEILDSGHSGHLDGGL